ncbi:hypothetical protein KJ866_01465 [Patescibacteria group bacterium]|nr:hypothetical protein [Patescibacteria group bacterium]
MNCPKCGSEYQKQYFCGHCGARLEEQCLRCGECGSEKQKRNFCENCGAQLRGKCPECGETEHIGRAVCATKYAIALTKKCEYVEKITRFRLIFGLGMIMHAGSLIPLFFALVYMLIMGNQTNWAMLKWVALIYVGVMMTFYLIGILRRIFFEKEAEAKFMKNFPDYAELLKRAEEAEKKN